MDRALAWLKAEGYALQEEQGFIAVKYQELTFLIPDTAEDETFLKIDLAFPLEAYEGLTEDRVLPLVNEIGQEVKIAKATYRVDPQGGKALVYSAEVLVCEADDFGKVLPRLFDLLGFAAQTLSEKNSKRPLRKPTSSLHAPSRLKIRRL